MQCQSLKFFSWGQKQDQISLLSWFLVNTVQETSVREFKQEKEREGTEVIRKVKPSLQDIEGVIYNIEGVSMI